MGILQDEIENGMALLTGGSFDDKRSYVRRASGVISGIVDNHKSGLNMFKARLNGTPPYTESDVNADIKTLVGKMRLALDMEQAEADRKYGTYALSGYIAKCDEMASGSANDQELADFCYEVTGAYAATIPGYSDYLGFVQGGEPVPARDIPMIKAKLMAYRDSVIQKQNKAAAQVLNVSASSASTSSANVEMTLSQAMSAVWSIPDSDMSEHDKAVLAKLLSELEESKKEGGKVKEAAKAVGNWLFDKAIESAPKIMPYVMQAIQSAAQ